MKPTVLRRLPPVVLRTMARVLSATADAWERAVFELTPNEALRDGDQFRTVEDAAALAEMAQRRVVEAAAPARAAGVGIVEETVDQMLDRIEQWRGQDAKN